MKVFTKKSVLVAMIWTLVVLFANLAVGQQKQDKKPAAPPKAAPAKSAPPKQSAPNHPTGGPGGAQRPNTAGGPNHGTTPGANHGTPGGPNRAGSQAGSRTTGTGNPNARTGTAAQGNRGAGAGANHSTTANSRKQPAGTKTVAMKSGGQATFRKDGHVRTIQTHGMTIQHGVHGDRRIVASHNGRQVVVTGRGGGYSQRAYYRHNGNVYVQRTYYRNGQYYAYGYRSYSYGGYAYYGYAPGYYYGPAYYGWAYNPWPAPVYYNWGWGGQPWYGYYGPYYSPYPAYPYAALWLTDYLIAANLRAAYEAQAAADGSHPALRGDSDGLLAELFAEDQLVAAHGGDFLATAGLPAGTTTAQMSPEVKQAIADQLKKEVAAEKEAAANKDKPAAAGEVPPALDPNTRYFVASSNVDVTTEDGAECELTPGDVVYRTGDKPDGDNMVDAVVKASKKDGCALEAKIAIETTDLQEMHNNLRQTMDEGLKKLADSSGKDGLPAAPDTKTTAGEVPAPAPDTTAAEDLKAAQKDADQAEAEVQQPNN